MYVCMYVFVRACVHVCIAMMLFSAVSSDPITATVNTTGSTVAGSEFILSCVVSKNISGLTDTPTAMWLNLNDGGVPVTSGNGITIATSNTNDVAVAVLTFDPLRTSHDGTYRCTGSITSPASDDSVDAITDIDLDVQSKRLFHHMYHSMHVPPPSPCSPPSCGVPLCAPWPPGCWGRGGHLADLLCHGEQHCGGCGGAGHTLCLHLAGQKWPGHSVWWSYHHHFLHLLLLLLLLPHPLPTQHH